MFEEDNPPNTYKKFRREVLHTIEEAEIKEGEEFPSALFVVNREPIGEIHYVDEIMQAQETNVDLEDVINIILPDIVKSNNSKYFGVTFSGTKSSSNGKVRDILIVLTGCAMDTDMMYAEISFDKKEKIYELEPWEKGDVMEYPELVVPFRRAIVLEG